MPVSSPSIRRPDTGIATTRRIGRCHRALRRYPSQSFGNPALGFFAGFFVAAVTLREMGPAVFQQRGVRGLTSTLLNMLGWDPVVSRRR
jgi:hypothetical protein